MAKQKTYATATPPVAPEQIPMAAGVTSTRVPLTHLIPTVAIMTLAERLEEGRRRKGDGAWNATTNNQECLDDMEFVLERISHVIRHACLLRDKIVAHDVAGMQADDDAGAVLFGGALLSCAVERLLRKHE